ncbi:MAG TPA: ankyrin repeat domain-containing protein, partial [Acetobacteraceae bacterium]|nr:ankyrin repeat domain-containing protein [Acetobacteraceae bacterium]
FDAINRGDLAAARDAVGRGADLDSRNVLGLTPLESAIDQGRYEIYFYLVSARGSVRNAPPPPEANMTPAQRAARDRQLRAEAERQAREAARAAAVAAGAGRGAAPAPAGPRLFAGDGGAPQPDVGFLGFDAGRGGGARPVRGGRGG